MSTSNSAAGQLTRSTNNARKKPMPRVEIQRFFREVVAQCYPRLEPNPIWFPLEGEARENSGDYAFFGVIDICDKLREKDPDFFYKEGPKDVAQKIVERVVDKKFDMIQTLHLHQAGILTFRLEESWIATRINNMLNDGIDTWAPTIYYEKRGKAVFIMPQYERLGWDMVRAIYIKDALVNLYLFSGADVGSGFSDDKAAELVQKHFIESPQGEIYSKRHHTSLVARPPQYVFTDLATLWYGIKSQKADLMVYMTPHRLRGYPEKCHIAAAKEGWLPRNWEDLGTLTTCGFQTFSREQQEMCDLFGTPASTEDTLELDVKFRRLGTDLGYSQLAFFECAFKFMCLKSHRLAECIFRFEDIFDVEGNTLASLLETRTLVRFLLKYSPRINLKLKALARKERELGLHLIEFTEVIESACRILAPHFLCEYLCNLCKLFMCCYREPGENMLGLCQATEVVMNKCFQLLGIAPVTPLEDECTKEFASLIFQYSTLDAKYCIIEDARDEHPNSRLEILSMFVSVKHSQFEEGYLSGSVTVVDKGRLANGDGWVRLDKNDDCHVSVFDREWHDAESFLNGSYIPLGNTSSSCSIPFSSIIEVDLLIKATSEYSDQIYLICNDDGKANLKDFWEKEDLKTMCGTFKFDCADGRILLDFVAIKEAVDTTMELTFKRSNNLRSNNLPSNNLPVRLSGLIKASYRKEILGESGFLGQYTAHIFRADPTTEYIYRDEPYLLPLYKSSMAVPNGCLCLCMHANLVDADTNKCIVDKEVDLYESESLNGVSQWKLECHAGIFELRVNWVHQARRVFWATGVEGPSREPESSTRSHEESFHDE